MFDAHQPAWTGHQTKSLASAHGILDMVELPGEGWKAVRYRDPLWQSGINMFASGLDKKQW